MIAMMVITNNEHDAGGSGGGAGQGDLDCDRGGRGSDTGDAAMRRC